MRRYGQIINGDVASKMVSVQARAKGTTFGRPKSVAKETAEIKRLYRKENLSKSEIARRLGIGRTSVRRLLESA